MGRAFDVVVVGAGCFGAWTARLLQRAGERVLLVDQFGPADARASSGGETRVIRMAYGPDAIYTRMAQRALPQWRAVFDEVGEPTLFRATGVLWLAHAGHTGAHDSAAVLTQAGIAHEMLHGDALRQRYPQLRVPDGGWGLFEPGSGVLFARRAVQALVRRCTEQGLTFLRARVLPPGGEGRIEHLQTACGRRLVARDYVFACGPWLDRVLPDVMGGRLFPTRQEVFYFGVPPDAAQFGSPDLPIWLDFDRDWYGFPDLDGRGFKIAHDRHGERIDPDTQERAPTPARIVQARAFLAQRFPALAKAPLVGAEVCQYENTSNGDLVIDRHPTRRNLWLAGGGSGHGFKLGPQVGAHVVERMLRDAPAETRFLLATKATEQRREVH